MNYNNKLEDTLDNINNIAKGKGFVNGVDWAEHAQRKGEITYGLFMKFKNAHDLRVRFSHGNARDISCSRETYELVKDMERRIAYSSLRKSGGPYNHYQRQGSPRRRIYVPDGAFRYDPHPYHKDIELSGNSGRRYNFSFAIVKEYQSRAYDDGTRFSGDGYTIYINKAPYMDWCSRQREFHFYNVSNNTPSICWNRLITSFQDANAIMFVWAKRYVGILDRCIDDKKVDFARVNSYSNRFSLPSGTFRSRYNHKKPKKTIHIAGEVYDRIMKTIGSGKPELGGILGWKDDKDYIDYFVFDKDAKVEDSAYSPNTEYLSSIINDDWGKKDIYVAGFVHSHPRGGKMLSFADIEYAIRIMKVLDTEYLFMPLINSSYDSESRFMPYIITNTGKVMKCQLEILRNIPKAKEETMDEIPNEEELNKLFDQMDEVSPILEENKPTTLDESSVFSRISSVIDIEYMNDCSIIGIGCGGSKSFYESMARIGVGHFYLMDGDKSSLSNVASQNGYISEVGLYKPEVIKRRLLDINSDVDVHTFNMMLTDELDDEFLEREIISKVGKTSTLVCAFTDDFYAQARISRIALKYHLPFICGQHHAKGMTSELVFWYPGVTKYSLREIARHRYESYENGYVNDVTSIGSPIFNTTRLNALCEKIAAGMLLYGKYPNHIYSSFLNKMNSHNLIIIRQMVLSDDNPLKDLFITTTDNFFDEVVWVDPEDIEDLEGVELEENNVLDTRDIFSKKEVNNA